MNKRTFALLVVLALFIGAAISTYAFWTINVENKRNVINTATLAVEVNDANRLGAAGSQITLNNLHPSNVYSETRKVVVENTGTIGLNYKLTFDSENNDRTIFNNVLVQFPGDENWYRMRDVEYVNSLGVGGVHNLNVKFRLDPAFSNLDYMGKTHYFKIKLVATQYEVPLYAMNQVTNAFAEAFDASGAARLKDFGNDEPGADNIYISDLSDNLGNGSERNSMRFDWQATNHVIFTYDADTGLIVMQVGDQTVQYQGTIGADFDSLLILMRDTGQDTEVKLTNITLNGNVINQDLVGQNTWNPWLLTGNVKDVDGGFTFEADVLLSGDLPKGERSKIELVFGK